MLLSFAIGQKGFKLLALLYLTPFSLYLRETVAMAPDKQEPVVKTRQMQPLLAFCDSCLTTLPLHAHLLEKEKTQRAALCCGVH